MAVARFLKYNFLITVEVCTAAQRCLLGLLCFV